jgi:hypothetical protein
MNTTPETNKFRASLDGMREINQRDRLLSHARKLEIERDEARESLAATESWSALLAEVGDNFRAENAELRAAIRNLRDVKGRHHTQIATEQLFALLSESTDVDASAPLTPQDNAKR